MPQAKVQQLISSLNESFGSSETSPQQQALLEQVNAHIHDTSNPDLSDPSFKETVEMIIEELSEEHPRAAAIARELLVTLGNIGV